MGREGSGTAEEQLGRIRKTAKEIVGMLTHGDRLIVTHGNGPQVGDILLKNELAKGLVPPMPLDVCGAESQGMIGYMLQQALEGEIGAQGLKTPCVTILTQVLVDQEDPAFDNPTKPIGPYYTLRQVEALKIERKWAMVEDSGRGYRRVVPSPKPMKILEVDTIARLFRSGVLVIAAGGGGIPVVRTKGEKVEGVEAVLDKDRTAALLATELGNETLLILTDIDRVYLDFDGPHRRPVDSLSVAECEGYLREGQFPAGSMGPKIESAIEFLRSGGRRVAIAQLGRGAEALAGRAGTTITP
jgi:carbamate kinase